MTRFPVPDGMISLGIVFPQTFFKLNMHVARQNEEFDKMVPDFIAMFGVERGGVGPITDTKRLREELAMCISDALGNGDGVTKLSLREYPEREAAHDVKFWRALSRDPMTRSLHPEWFKEARIVLVMVCGSVADEHTFWAMK